ncbi:hypothetical protein AADZ90_000235 [Aestuariibius sp. 2305UL40-4]|uniref:hypothetical protein n=1 Tax=Aestuariibius violaceus TaxID=3234132 RepID=UPI00345E8969
MTAQTTFQDRIARIEETREKTMPPVTPSRPDRPAKLSLGRSGPGFFAKFAVGMLFIPLGFILGFVTNAALDAMNETGSWNGGAVLYVLAAAHLALFVGIAVAIITRGRIKLLNHSLFTACIGYGIASLLVATVIG